MKIILKVFFLCSIVWYSVGGVSYLTFKRMEVKSTNQKNTTFRKIQKASRISLQLSAKQFHSLNWVKSNKEFVKNGFYYDVMSVQKLGNSYQIVCFLDKSEKALDEKLKNALQESGDATTSFSLFLIPFDVSTCEIQTVQFSKVEVLTASSNLFTAYQFALKEYAFSPFPPPPNC